MYQFTRWNQFNGSPTWEANRWLGWFKNRGIKAEIRMTSRYYVPKYAVFRDGVEYKTDEEPELESASSFDGLAVCGRCGDPFYVTYEAQSYCGGTVCRTHRDSRLR